MQNKFGKLFKYDQYEVDFDPEGKYTVLQIVVNFISLYTKNCWPSLINIFYGISGPNIPEKKICD